MDAIWAMAMKDLRLLFRDRMGFFFAFFFPLAIAVFFGMIFQQHETSRIGIALVNEEPESAGSRAFTEDLKGASELQIFEVDKQGRKFDRASATDAVRRGDYTAFVALPKGFGATRDSMFFGKGTTLVLGVDPSHSAERGMLEGILTKYGFMQLQNSFQDPEAMRKQVGTSMAKLRSSTNVPESTRRVLDKFFGDLDTFLVDLPTATKESDANQSDAGQGMGGWQPIRIEKAEIIQAKAEGPSNPYAITFPQGIIWGVMGCALGFGISLAQEKSRGTLIRLRTAPITGAQVLAGKALACFLATVGVCVMLIAISMAPPFNVRPSSLGLLALAVLATAVCFVGVMMMLAVFSGSSERGGQGLGWGVMLMFAMIGGGMIPRFVMPDWMQAISNFSPIRWSILALERGVWREATLVEELIPCGVLVAIGVVGFAFGASRMARSTAA
jgi:ABC-2 type transport system permease protein